MVTFADRLKKLRNEKGVTLKEMAKDLNTTDATLSRYENGVREPKMDFIKIIADYFNVSSDYLMGKSDERKPAEQILLNDKQKEIEIKELLNRYNVMLDGEALDEDAKESVLDLLRFLRDRDKKKGGSD